MGGEPIKDQCFADFVDLVDCVGGCMGGHSRELLGRIVLLSVERVADLIA